MRDQDSIPEELLVFFKAVVDANRLKILGLLAQNNLSVEQLSEILNLRPSTVSHHLSKLMDAGLVSTSTSSFYNIYRLENSTLESIAQRLLSEDTLPDMANEVDLDSYDRKVISDYILPDGRLKTIPAQRKKLGAVLRFVIRSFDLGHQYSEKQVNEILGNFHQDTASLRRELIEDGLMDRSRSGKEYWRVEKTEELSNNA